MVAALHEDLVAADRERFLNLLVQLFAWQNVCLRLRLFALKGAEIANGRTDIRVIDVAVDVVGAIRLGMQPARDRIGRSAQADQILAIEKLNALIEAEALALNRFRQELIDICHEIFSGSSYVGRPSR